MSEFLKEKIWKYKDKLETILANESLNRDEKIEQISKNVFGINGPFKREMTRQITEVIDIKKELTDFKTHIDIGNPNNGFEFLTYENIDIIKEAISPTKPQNDSFDETVNILNEAIRPTTNKTQNNSFEENDTKPKSSIDKQKANIKKLVCILLKKKIIEIFKESPPEKVLLDKLVIHDNIINNYKNLIKKRIEEIVTKNQNNEFIDRFEQEILQNETILNSYTQHKKPVI